MKSINKVRKSLSLAISVLMIASLASVMILTVPMVSATHTSSATIGFTTGASEIAGGDSSLDVEVTNSVAPSDSITTAEIDFTDTGFTAPGIGDLPDGWSGAVSENVVTYTATDGGIAEGGSEIFVVLVTNPTTSGVVEPNPMVTTTDDAGENATGTTGSGDILISYEAVTAGTEGNSIIIEYVDPGIINQPLTVENEGTAITVSLATNEAGELISTASEVAAKINDDPDASALVHAESEGTGTVLEESVTLDGGVNSGTHSSTPTEILTIDLAAIDHYEVSDITSPQVAGTPFSVTIKAQDQYNNYITTGTEATEDITITFGKTDDWATWTPTSVTTVAGTATVSITMTVAQEDQTITFTGDTSGKSGISGAFDVVFADLTAGAVKLEPGLTTTYTIVFKTGVTIPASGYMEIVFPEGYSLIGSPTTFEATSTDTNYDETGNFTYFVDVGTRTAKITLNVEGISLTKGSTVTIKLSDVTNPATAGDYAITINTKKSDRTLIETSAKDVTITGAGTATISPETPVVRGSTETWTIEYTVPAKGVVAGGGIEVTIPDGWTAPQITDVTAAGYVTTSISTAEATPTLSVSGMVIKVTTDTALAEGATITVKYGDTSDGAYPDAAAKAQTTAEADVEFKVALDRDANGVFADIASSPTLDVIAADGDGTATISPVKDVVAGSTGTWTIKYKVPADGVAVDGGIEITIPDGGWTAPQIGLNTNPGYVTCETDEAGDVTASVDGQVITVTVATAALVEGDNIIVVYGDNTDPGGVATAQTTAEIGVEFTVASDTDGDTTFEDIAVSPTLNVIHSTLYDYDVDPGDGPYTAGVPFDVTITAVDEWDNPLGADYKVTKSYAWTSGADIAPDGIHEPDIGYPLVSADFTDGVAVKTVTLYKAESVTFKVTDSGGKSGESTSIAVKSAAEILDFESLVGSKTATIKFSGGVTTDLENALVTTDFTIEGITGIGSIENISHIAGEDMAVIRFNEKVTAVTGTVKADLNEIYDIYGNPSSEATVDMTDDRNVLSLENGWNLVSLPKVPSADWTIADSGLIAVYTYDNGEWSAVSDADSLDAVFIKADGLQELALSWTTDVQTTPPAKELEVGWNLIGTNMDPDTGISVLVTEFLDSVTKSWSTLFSPNFNLTSWTVTSGEESIEDKVLSYEGYWIYMTAADELAGRIV